MKYSGSITVKKTELLALIEDENYIFRSEVSKENKMFSWGRKTGLEQLLIDDNHTCYLLPPNWNYALLGFPEFWDSLFRRDEKCISAR